MNLQTIKMNFSNKKQLGAAKTIIYQSKQP